MVTSVGHMDLSDDLDYYFKAKEVANQQSHIVFVVMGVELFRDFNAGSGSYLLYFVFFSFPYLFYFSTKYDSAKIYTYISSFYVYGCCRETECGLDSEDFIIRTWKKARGGG